MSQTMRNLLDCLEYDINNNESLKTTGLIRYVEAAIKENESMEKTIARLEREKILLQETGREKLDGWNSR